MTVLARHPALWNTLARLGSHDGGHRRPGLTTRNNWLDDDSWHGRVDAGNVAGVAGDDGVMTLPGAEHDVHVHDITMVSARAHQPDATGHAERHDRDVDVTSCQEPRKAGLARAAPRLRDDFSGDADGPAAPPGRLQARLHGHRLGRVVERKERAGVERQPGSCGHAYPAILPLRGAWSASPAWSARPA